ncbi:PREDICTED: putative F-box protein At1g12855 [Camelina sativa]|uniref:F-box protein At1g12855 n=1 Tax=Camelina sativa TaxID=90675 RepID=A0ABM0X4D8_CAMSA|nr:PREDICTED: putative F-box protein At1g12855 [Camelina sativa]
MEAIASSTTTSLMNDVIEEILLKLPVKSILRLKSLSKQWRSTIQSRSFAERHLKVAQRSHMEHSKVIAMSNHLSKDERRSICFRTIISLESTPLLSFTLPKSRPIYSHFYVSKSCDGLFCIYSSKSEFIHVVNPATRWFRQLPPARIQILMHKLIPNLDVYAQLPPALFSFMTVVPALAIVKDIDYKLVWLYNSDEYNSDTSSPNEGLTKCEVFDFRVNSWRYLTCIPSYLISNQQGPEYVNGSNYWFTEPYNGEIKVIALDIHTETFRLLPKIHPVIATSSPKEIYMCTLDKRLCIMTKVRNTKLNEIWRLKASEDMWEKVYTIDLFSSSSSSESLFQKYIDWNPVVICDNKKILFSCLHAQNLIEYDPQTKSVCSFFNHPDQCKILRHVPYIQSLISNI